MSATARRPLLAVDGDSFGHRAYHGVPKSVLRGAGKAGNALVGFANTLLRLYDAEQPRAVFVGFDTLDAPTYRHDALEGYQGGRDFADDLLEQLAMLPVLSAAFGFATAKAAGFEADDFIASAATAEERAGGTALVASGDRDSFQLASAAVTILYPAKGGILERIGPAEVRARYGVDPQQVPDFIALRGDPSDRIPGAKGVGAIGAANLLGRFETLEDALLEGRFSSQADDLRLYRRIATMDRAAPIPPLPDQQPTWTVASELVREWGLNQLADRLAERATAKA